MTITQELQPRWASTPGTTILATLRSRGQSPEDLADLLSVPDAIARGIVTGSIEITSTIAEAIADGLGGTPEFWLRREEQYRASIELVQTDELARRLPLSQMVSLGWIQRRTGWIDRASGALDYFGVSTIHEWEAEYAAIASQAKLRASTSFDLDEVAVAAWIRQGEIRASIEIPATGQWSPVKLREALGEVRGLTKVPDPSVFIPKLQSLMAVCGVAVVVVRAPSNCPVSGAAIVSRDGRRLIVLSGRHLSDDHFWFTFFHEAGHHLLHADDGPFVDSFDDSLEPTSAVEAEANEYAATTLVPGGIGPLTNGSASAPRLRTVVSFAHRHGIAPGIVVGQLQNAEAIRRNQLNGLRRRYRWDGPTLKT